ncbi:hypothetical protein [Rubripirellula obstinata]|nr:hypothetical protein [Rubripirellula obstinata]
MVLGTACFFGWRNYNPERSAIIAIENASGRVHFKYQGPAMAPFPDRRNASPDSMIVPQVLVRRFGSTESPPMGFWEFLTGDNAEQCVVAVEVALDKLNGDLVDRLESLSRLDTIIVEMPTGMLGLNSKEVLKVRRIQERLAVNVEMTFDHGF